MPIITVQRFECPKCGHQEDITPSPSSTTSVRSVQVVATPEYSEPKPSPFTWADGPTRLCGVCGGQEGRCYIPLVGRNGTELAWRCTNPECESRKEEVA